MPSPPPSSMVRLRRHIDYVVANGGMYKCHNGNLLYHGCIPMNEDGTFRKVKVGDRVTGAVVAFAPDNFGRGEVYQALTGGAI